MGSPRSDVRVQQLWQELEQSGTEEWSNLQERLSREDLTVLLEELTRIEPPERIAELADLERAQAEQGAGFHGMLPDQITEELPRPVGMEGILGTAVYLTGVRERNLEAIEAAFSGGYPLTFTARDLPAAMGAPPEGWALDLDLTGIRALLDHLATGNPDPGHAQEIAGMPAFTEMMRHRRELGYVPEPLIDKNGLAWCIERAASQDPIDRLWRWLSPHNLFDLADLVHHLSSYSSMIDTLETTGDRLTHAILARLAPFAPSGTRFADQLSFAIGWAIRGWATESTGGINLEHFKDDFPCMLETLIHETFHRLQARICRADTSHDGDGFERITSLPLEDPKQKKLYTVLAYLMLEGSATFVGTTQPDPMWAEQAAPALDLLNRSLAALETGDLDAIDGILNEGLTSNGPFYGFGAWLSEGIVAQEGPRALGEALASGAVHFLLIGGKQQGLSLPVELVSVCQQLQSTLDE